MNERESYTELIYIIVGKFKDEAKNNLGHMCSLLHLSALPFQHIPREEDMNMKESIHVEANQGTG